MSYVILNLILIFLAVILQISLVPQLAISGGYPNFILLVSTALIFVKRETMAMLWFVLGGLLLDLHSSAPFGFYTGVFIGIYFIINFLVRRFLIDVNFFAAALLFLLVSFFADIPFLFLNFDLRILISQGLWNAFLGLVFYYFIDQYFKMKGRSPDGYFWQSRK